MVDQLRQDDTTSGTPTDPLERALAAAHAGLSGNAQPAVPDPEDDDLTDEATPSDDAPVEDDDLDLDDDDEETPSDPASGGDAKTQDSTDASKAKAKASDEKKQPDKAKERDSQLTDKDVQSLSRKDRGKFINEIRDELKKEQEARDKAEKRQKQLEEEARDRAENEKLLDAEIEKALGSKEAYDKALNAGLEGDASEKRKYQVWTKNRKFFGRLVRAAELQAKGQIGTAFNEKVEELGLDVDEANKGSFQDTLEYVHRTATDKATAAATEKLEALQDKYDTLVRKYKDLRRKASLPTREVTTGGNPVVPGQFDLKKSLGSDGLPTDELDAAIRRYGSATVLNGPSQVR